MANRKRNRAVTLRMTEDEFEFFRERMRISKRKNQTDFFITVLSKKPIIVVEELKPILTELKKQGGNLNQVVRRLHKYGEFNNVAETVLLDCWGSYRLLLKLLGNVTDITE